MKMLSLIIICILIYSCEEDTYRMEKGAKHKADSIFQIQYQSLIKEQDSICTFRKKMNMQHLLDSIVEIRKREIIQLQKGL